MTANSDWHGLTFNPARGNPSTVGTLAKQMTDTSVWLGEAFRVLESVKDQKDTWTGKASIAFAEKLGELPSLLDDAHRSLRDAGKALSGWQDTLTAHQRKAVELEQQAREALKAAGEADTAAAQAAERANQPITYPTDDPAAEQAARMEAQRLSDAAATAANNAQAVWDRVEDIRRQAQDLRDRWEDDADAVADALENATDIAPGLLDAVGDFFSDMGEWVVDNLGMIGDIAGMISAIAGALAFIPVLAPVAGPIALAAGGIALLAHGAEMAVEDKWSDPGAWAGLGADALGVLPGVGAAARGLSTATDTLHVVDGVGTAAMTGGKVFLQEAGQVADAAKMYKWVGERAASAIGGNADTIATVTHNTVNLGAQAPVAADYTISNETTGDLKDGASYPAAGVAAGQTAGIWSDTGTALKNLGTSLGDFAKAVG